MFQMVSTSKLLLMPELFLIRVVRVVNATVVVDAAVAVNAAVGSLNDFYGTVVENALPTHIPT